jgi:hypothetical protein
VSDEPTVAPIGQMTDLVAFEVEGSGYYLVPLGTLDRYEIRPTMTGESFAPLGWGWALPVVRWNTFHESQIDTQIALAPGVVARLAAHHFAPSALQPSPTIQEGPATP